MATTYSMLSKQTVLRVSRTWSEAIHPHLTSAADKLRRNAPRALHKVNEHGRELRRLVLEHPRLTLAGLTLCAWVGAAFVPEFGVWRMRSLDAAVLLSLAMLLMIRASQQGGTETLTRELRRLGGSLQTLQHRVGVDALRQVEELDRKVEELDDRTLLQLRNLSVALTRHVYSELELRRAFDIEAEPTRRADLSRKPAL
jgi:hypothetical protein